MSATVQVQEAIGGLEDSGSSRGYKNIYTNFPKLLKSENVQRWLRRTAQSTKPEYLIRFEKFLAWTSKEIGVSTPDQFITWIEKQGKRYGLKVQDLIDKYTEKMTDA